MKSICPKFDVCESNKRNPCFHGNAHEFHSECRNGRCLGYENIPCCDSTTLIRKKKLLNLAKSAKKI